MAASKFTDKVVIVTGSSSGIGEAIAFKLASLGACVVVCGRNEERTKKSFQECVSAGGGDTKKFMMFCGDLADRATRERLVDDTRSLPHLEKTKGNIVCISSVLSTKTLLNRVVYQMSKAGMDQMVRALAVSEGPKGIRINAVIPGVVATRLYRDPNFDESARIKGASSKTPLLGRVSTEEEQADVVLFLAGSDAGFVTGQCVKVDGGFTLS